MKSGGQFTMPERHPGAFYRLFGGGDDLVVSFEYLNTPPATGLFADALASPVTGLYDPEMKARVEAARAHILLDVSHGALGPVSGADASPTTLAMMADTATATGNAAGSPASNAAAFTRRLETLALMARVLSDHADASAVHWTQSNQLLDPDTFETMAGGGFPGPLSIHPLLFSDPANAPAPNEPEALGVRSFGARHWLGREVLVRPSPLPWSANYEAILAFCSLAAMNEGAVIPDGDTFGPPPPQPGEHGDEHSDEHSGEIWRVLHHDTDPAQPGAATAPAALNDDGDAFSGAAPIFELVPLRHDACGFVAEEYARSASILCQRAPKDTVNEPESPVHDEAEKADHADADETSSTLAELKAALEEGRAHAAANPPDPLPASLQASAPNTMPSAMPVAGPTPLPKGPQAGHLSLAGEAAVSGRSLRAKVFGKKQP